MPIVVKKNAQNVLLLVGVTALSLVLALIAMELILRYSPLGKKIAPERFYFFDAPRHFRDQHKEFGYSPFSSNREVAVFAQGDHAWIEYDVSYTANNAGLVQRRNIDPAKAHIVIVGDSFTHGQGTSPWFYELENELQEWPLANLGIIGTGILHWEKALDWFQRRVAKVDKVVIVFIASDFQRPYWFARSTPHELQFCYEISCGMVFTRLFDADPFALAQYRRDLLQKQALARSRGSSSMNGVLNILLAETRTGTLLLDVVRSTRTEPSKYLDENMASLQVLLARHDVAFALHLPEKREAAQGRWSAASTQVRSFVSTLKLNYVDGMERCALEASDFREIDAHPNATGYRKIQKCVATLIKENSRAPELLR